MKSTKTKIYLKPSSVFSKGLLILLIVLIIGLSHVYAFPEFSPDEGVLIVEKNTGDVLYEQNVLEKFYPASTTKLMTALILTETVDDLSQKVTVGNEVEKFGWEASQAGLDEGDVISYQDLLNGLLLPSGNDAAETIAINVGKILLNNNSASNEEANKAFIAQMNKRAFELGMYDTNFVNPHGLHNENHYSTPRDMMLLALAAYNVPVINKTASSKTYNLTYKEGTDVLRNTNQMLYDTLGEYLGTQDATPNPYKSDFSIAGKTGNTDEGGRTFVFNSQVDGADVYGVIFKTDEEGIFAQSKSVLDDLKNNYEFKTIEEIEPLVLENVHFVDNATIPLNELDLQAYLNDEQYENIEIDYELDEKYVNPETMELAQTVYPGQKIGDLVICSQGKVIKDVPITVENRIRVKNWTDFIYDHFFIIVLVIIIVLVLLYLFMKNRIRRKYARKRRKKSRKPRVS